MLLSDETVEQLRGFLQGDAQFSEFYAWLISAQDDTDLSDPERDALRELRLLLLEIDEGQRPRRDAEVWALSALAALPRRIRTDLVAKTS